MTTVIVILIALSGIKKTAQGGLKLTPGLGFEPRQRDSESLVLPLHHPGFCINIL